jgi:hypothetical protein
MPVPLEPNTVYYIFSPQIFLLIFLTNAAKISVFFIHKNIVYFIMSFYTVRSESLCALRLRYVDLVVSIEVAIELYCCFTVFSC